MIDPAGLTGVLAEGEIPALVEGQHETAERRAFRTIGLEKIGLGHDGFRLSRVCRVVAPSYPAKRSRSARCGPLDAGRAGAVKRPSVLQEAPLRLPDPALRPPDASPEKRPLSHWIRIIF